MPIGVEVRPGRRRVEPGIYQQPNGKYMVCFMVAGKPRFRVVGFDLEQARRERATLAAAAGRGEMTVCPSLRFGAVVDRWLSRYEASVAAGRRRPRTLEAHRYYLKRHLLPHLRARRASAIRVDDVCAAIAAMRSAGCSEKTIANALGTLQGVLRFARRRGWVVVDPIAELERDERPSPRPRRQRVLGREEVARLLARTDERYRPLVATALLTGMRISELLGLIWRDVDLDAGAVHVRAQLSRPRPGVPATRMAPKTPAAVRDIPLAPQLVAILRAHRAAAATTAGWVFPSTAGTPLGRRNAQRRGLARAATRAGLDGTDWPPLRFHDLRHTFASHLIVDVGLDVAQVSRILGHAQMTTTLAVYTHLFDHARHAHELQAKLAASALAALGEPAAGEPAHATVVALADRRGRRPATTRRCAPRRRAP